MEYIDRTARLMTEAIDKARTAGRIALYLEDIDLIVSYNVKYSSRAIKEMMMDIREIVKDTHRILTEIGTKWKDELKNITLADVYNMEKDVIKICVEDIVERVKKIVKTCNKLNIRCTHTAIEDYEAKRVSLMKLLLDIEKMLYTTHELSNILG